MQKEYVKLIEEYCSAIKNHFCEKLVSICLFGSVARGEAKPDSDIDILIVADALPKDIGMRIKETNYIHQSLKKTQAYISLRKSNVSGLVSDIFFTPEEIKRHPPILLDVIDDGIIFYDKNSFLSNELKTLKERLEFLKLYAPSEQHNRGVNLRAIFPPLSPFSWMQAGCTESSAQGDGVGADGCLGCLLAPRFNIYDVIYNLNLSDRIF